MARRWWFMGRLVVLNYLRNGNNQRIIPAEVQMSASAAAVVALLVVALGLGAWVIKHYRHGSRARAAGTMQQQPANDQSPSVQDSGETQY